VFLTSAVVGGKWSALRFGQLIPGKRVPGTHLIGDYEGLGAGLNPQSFNSYCDHPNNIYDNVQISESLTIKVLHPL